MVHRGIWLTPVDEPCIEVNFLPGTFVMEKMPRMNSQRLLKMWSGDNFDYSLRRLLLLYCCSHFALNWDMRYRNLIYMKAVEIKERPEQVTEDKKPEYTVAKTTDGNIVSI
jgi:hypothetical protein